MREKIIISAIVVLLGCCASLSSVAAPRNITEADEVAFSEMQGSPLISADGKWLIYVWAGYDDSGAVPKRRDPELILRRTDTKQEIRRDLGAVPGGARLKLTATGDRIVFAHAGTRKDRAYIATLELAGGAVVELGGAQDYKLSPDGKYVALSGYPDSPEAVPALTVRSLSGGMSQTWAGVTEYAFAPAGERLAFVDGAGLHEASLRTLDRRRLHDGTAGKIQFLRWSPKGKSLAAVLSRTEKESGAILLASAIGTKAPAVHLYDPATWSGFPVGQRLVTHTYYHLQGAMNEEVLRWRDEEDGIFFEIEPAPSAEPTVPNVVLWHWKDIWTPGQKRSGSPERYLCNLVLPEGKFVRLADEQLTTVLPQGKGRYALGYNWKRYGWTNYVVNYSVNLQKRDYDYVEVRTGKRRNAIASLKVSFQGKILSLRTLVPQLTPDGKRLVYADADGNIHARDVETDVDRNLTDKETDFKHIPFGENTNDASEVPAVMQGFTSDSRHILVSDADNIWLISLSGGNCLNLTRDGRTHDILYQDVGFVDQPESWYYGNNRTPDWVSLSRPLYLKATDKKNGHTSLAMLMPGEKKIRTVGWEDAQLDYLKAARADTWLMVRTNVKEGTRIWRLNARLTREVELAEIHPEIEKFNWYPSPTLLTYRDSIGHLRTGTLFLPVGADIRRPLPGIVTVYAGATAGFQYTRFMTYPWVRWLREGYAFISVDLEMSGTDWAKGITSSTTATVDAAVATGYVDRNRLGLIGHSLGGMDTFTLVTRTDIFKAAVPQAGVADFRSWYLTDGEDRAAPVAVPSIYRGTVGDITQPFWENEQAYKRSSPLENVTKVKTPLLIIHGDKDSSVPFSQSQTFFTALRLLGDRPVVLMQYVGADHGVEEKDIPDVDMRVKQFFAHFLKGAPAPKWWTEGLSYPNGQTPAPSVDSDDRILPHAIGQSWPANLTTKVIDRGWVPQGRTPAIQWIAVDPDIGPATDPIALGNTSVALPAKATLIKGGSE